MENHPVLDSSGNASPARQAPFQDHWPERSIGSDREEAKAVGGSVKRAFGDALMTEDVVREFVEIAAVSNKVVGIGF